MNNTKAALLEAIKQSDLSIREKLALRLALIFHADKVDAIVKEALVQEGVTSLDSDVSKTDWAAVIKFFIENILPLLLKFLV